MSMAVWNSSAGFSPFCIPCRVVAFAEFSRADTDVQLDAGCWWTQRAGQASSTLPPLVGCWMPSRKRENPSPADSLPSLIGRAAAPPAQGRSSLTWTAAASQGAVAQPELPNSSLLAAGRLQPSCLQPTTPAQPIPSQTSAPISPTHALCQPHELSPSPSPSPSPPGSRRIPLPTPVISFPPDLRPGTHPTCRLLLPPCAPRLDSPCLDSSQPPACWASWPTRSPSSRSLPSRP